MQTNLEKIGIEKRQNTLPSNEYVKTAEYSETHPNAISDGDIKGKGAGDGGYTHTIPTASFNNETKNMIKPQLNTEVGGGKYDIEGRNNIGGRRYLMSIGLYNAEHEYGKDIETTINREDGQIVL